MIDIHAHILPGVDDGAQDMRMTEEMLARAADAGISTIICTPHVYRPDAQERNRLPFAQVKGLAQAQGISLQMGCEFNYRVLLKTGMDDLQRYCLAGTPCILLEFSNDRLVPDWEILLTEIVEKGYMPIIAHPERYTYIQKDIGIAEEMLSYGCELQVDAGGLMAGLFSAERKTARKLLSEGMVSYIASDAHRPEHYATFAKVRRAFEDEWPQDNQLMRMLGRIE